jgi:TonB family protein
MSVRALALTGVFLTVALLFATPSLPAQAATAGGCVTSAAKLTQPPKVTLSPDAKITAKTVAFEIDVGSDGRVRGLQLDQSSGDGAVDLSFRQALQAATYEPPQTGCVAYSGGLYLSYELPAQGTPHPAPPARLNPHCTPYVLAFLTPAARDRKRTGTATVAVELDAAGTRTAEPALRQSTGSAALDREALRIARTGQYNFLRLSSCTPQPFTHNLELTFQ